MCVFEVSADASGGQMYEIPGTAVIGRPNVDAKNSTWVLFNSAFS